MDDKNVKEFSSETWTLADLRAMLDELEGWDEDSTAEFTFRHERGRDGLIRVVESED